MKIITHKIAAGLPVLLFLILIISGCKKDSLPAQNTAPENGNTIKYVLNDNFTFSSVYGALTYVGLQDTLTKAGPYTFLAPDNGAFQAVTGQLTTFFGGQQLMRNMMRYSLLHGLVSFKSLPLVQNKPILTTTGGNIYVSKYLNGTDTVTTVNGVKLTSTDNPASNGLIQVLPQVLNPELHSKTIDYIHNDTTLTLFAAALQRSGLDVSLLAANDVYTILAPSNTAFQQSGKLGRNLGISTLDSILIADPDKLSTLLKYHITPGRNFEGDFYKYISTNPNGITMLNGGKVMIGGNEASYHSMTFLGSGNNGIASALIPYNSFAAFVNYSDIPCGNGVIHEINRVLIP